MRKALPVLLCAAVGLAGCSLGGGEDVKPAGEAPNQVSELVIELGRAVRARDWRGICDHILTSAARRRAGGRNCPKLLGDAAGDLVRPRLRLVSVVIHKDRLVARVRSQAVGQAPIEDELQLKGERGRLRVDGLGG